MPSRRIVLPAFLCFAAAAPAAAQQQAAAATCDAAALRAVAGDPGRLSREGGRISLVPPQGMRDIAAQIPPREGTAPLVWLIPEAPATRAGTELHLLFINEVPHLNDRHWQDRWRGIAESPDRRSVRWISRAVASPHGLRWYRLDYVKQARRRVDYIGAFQDRTLIAGFTTAENDTASIDQFERSLASLQLRDCPSAPGETTLASSAGGGTAQDADVPADAAGGVAQDAVPRESGPVCEEAQLQAHLAAGDPRRSAIADGRVSLVPAEGLTEYTSVQLASALRNGTRPERMFGGDSAGTTLRYLTLAANVSAPSFGETLKRWINGSDPERVSWISDEVVEVGGTPWRRLEYTVTDRRSGVQNVALLYATGFQARTLVALFSGLPRHREALARSAATLEVRDCRVTRPLAAWVDSAAVLRAVAGVEVPPLPNTMKPVFRVTFDTLGVVEMVEPVYAEIPASYAQPVVAALRAAIRPQPRTRQATSHLVRVVGGAAPAIDAPGLVERAPEPRNRQLIEQQLGQIKRTLMFRPGTSRQAAPGFYVRMHVRADGMVDRESIQLVRGSGVQWLDQQILRLARAAYFFPGQVGGLPATTWTVMPMTLF